MSFLRSSSSAEGVEISEIENSEIGQQLEVCDIKDEICGFVEDLYSLELTCRTCSRNMPDNLMLPIFETNLEFNTSPIEVIEEIHFGNLKIKLDDGLPQQICIDCMTNLTNISSYRKECENNQLILSEYFRNKSKISATNKINIINNIEICQLNDKKNEIEFEEEQADNSETEICFVNCIDQEDENSFVNVEFDGDTDNIVHQNSEESTELTSDKNLILQQRTEEKSDKISRRQKFTGIRKTIVQCPSCKDTFRSKSAFEIHRKKLHPKKPRSRNICPICNQVFELASILNDHLQTHNVEKPFKCDMCDKFFRNKVNLSRHNARRHIKGDFECSICFRHFDSKELYNYHIKSHDPGKRYKCQYCEKTFMQMHHLSNHERIHTGIKPFKCDVCGRAFRQKLSLQVHSYTHTGARPYVCKTCGKDFRQRGSLVIHMRYHNGIKPFQCEICGKSFTQKSVLTTHLRIHTGEKPYKCDQCDCAFITPSYLNFHKYSKHGGPYPVKRKDGPHSCGLCSKILKSSRTLQMHIKAHSEEKKFTCEVCGTKFRRMNFLKTHFDRVHLKLKSFPCQYCDKAFAQSSDRNVHMRRNHNIHSNDENKSSKTENLNNVQYVLTKTQRGSTLITSLIDAATGGTTRMGEYPQDIYNAEEELEIEV